MLRVLALALALLAACGEEEEPEIPEVCTRGCGHIFDACGYDEIVIRAGDRTLERVKKAGCLQRCSEAGRSMRVGYECAAAKACDDRDGLSGCISYQACFEAEQAVGGCYGAGQGFGFTDRCVSDLATWAPCVECTSTRVCLHFSEECRAVCTR